jgi:hypothetical protein
MSASLSTAPRAAPAMRPWKRIAAYGQEFILLGAILALCIVVGIVNPRFLGANN